MGRVKDYYFDEINDFNDDDFNALFEDEQDSMYQALDPKEAKKAAKVASKHISQEIISDDEPEQSNNDETYY